MVATQRRLLLALVALAACTPVLAGVTCTPNADGSWTCSGDGDGDGEGSYPPGTVVTNMVGVCTNCTAMSPDVCNQIKSSSLSQIEEMESVLSTVKSKLQIDGVSLDSFLSSLLNDISQFDLSLNDFAYYLYYDSGASPDAGEKFDNDILYPHYDLVTKAYNLEQLQGLEYDIETLADYQLPPLKSQIQSIDCSSCSASFNDPVKPSEPSSPSSQCPCLEQFEELKNVLVNDFLPRIKNIDNNVTQLTNLLTIGKHQLETMREGFHNVTNLFNRLDDYVLDDFSNKVFQIQIDVNYIASNLAQKVQRIFIDQSYSNAQFYVRQDSDTPIEMSELDETLIPEGDLSQFDWGEFENLPWFTRVEYLLLKLNGVYVTTNNNANAGVSNAEENQKSIEDGFSDFKSSVNGDITTGFTQVGTSISTFFSSFNSAVSTQGDKVVEIQLMSNFIGQDPLMLNIDPDVADACRTISSLLWTVLFGFLLYKILLTFWVVFVDTINWWVNQTQGFVK